MRRYLPVILAVASLALAGCTSSKRVIVDPQGVNQAQYQRDLVDCQKVADQVGTLRDSGEGAVGGALVGGLLGAIVGNSSTAAMGAGVGAVFGGAGKAGDAQQTKSQVLKNCMRGRGYRVLN